MIKEIYIYEVLFLLRIYWVIKEEIIFFQSIVIGEFVYCLINSFMFMNKSDIIEYRVVVKVQVIMYEVQDWIYSIIEINF